MRAIYLVLFAVVILTAMKIVSWGFDVVEASASRQQETIATILAENR